MPRMSLSVGAIISACRQLTLHSEGAINYPLVFYRIKAAHYNQYGRRQYWQHQHWRPRGKGEIQKDVGDAVDTCARRSAAAVTNAAAFIARIDFVALR
jgi:hypothetical protein